MKQDPEAKYVVLYNAAGTNVSAALHTRKPGEKPFYVEHKIYRAEVQTSEEGAFLVAILNCEEVNRIIKPFQSMGLLGERDIEKKVLDIPIPQYDKNNEIYRMLAEIGSGAAAKVKEAVKSGEIQGTLAKTRTTVRTLLSKELKEIDKLVKKILS